MISGLGILTWILLILGLFVMYKILSAALMLGLKVAVLILVCVVIFLAVRYQAVPVYMFTGNISLGNISHIPILGG